MAAVAAARRMDTREDFGSRPFTVPVVVSSTSGDGEPEPERGYNFTGRRKNRRKTITLNDLGRSARAGLGAQSLSESAFGSPSPLPLKPLPLDTSISSLDQQMQGTSNLNSSARRTSSRNIGAGPPSPTKKNATDIGTSRQSRSSVKRNLTLPVHLTDSLKKMQITRDDTSVESFELNTPTGGPAGSSVYQGEAGMDAENGMDVDDEARPVAAVNPSTAGVPSSPRKRTRKRARSLPPRPRVPEEDDDCDADDESGVGKGGVDDEEGLGGKNTPIVTITPRGRKRDVGGDSSSEVAMEGLRPSGMMPESSTDVIRRSARRLKPIPMSASRIMDHAPAHVNKKRARTRERNERGRNLDEFERSLKRIRKEDKI